MDVSLSAIESRIFNLRAWSSPSTKQTERVRDSINMALDRLAGEVPEALVPSIEHIDLLADVVGSNTDVAARLNATSDELVLKFTTDTGALLSSWVPVIDGTWNGVMHLEVTADGGTNWSRRQSMEFFQDGSNYYVTLDRPWHNTTDTLMDFRIYQPQFFMSSDVMQMLELRLFDDNRTRLLPISLGTAQRGFYIDRRGQTNGPPSEVYPGHHYQLQAPQLAPLVVNGPRNTWVGPERHGEFKICYTIVRGRRSVDHQHSRGDVPDPIWESAPSPEVSFAPGEQGIINPGADSSILMLATNVDAMLGFDVSGETKETHSGYRIRWYVARETVDLGSPGDAAFARVDRAGVYYFLAETGPTQGYNWTGATTPDYNRRLKYSTGYMGYRVYPHQDQAYVLDIECLRAPEALVAPQDTAPIRREVLSAFYELILHYVCLHDGADQEGAAIHMQRFERQVKLFRQRCASPGGQVVPRSIAGGFTRERAGRYSSS